LRHFSARLSRRKYFRISGKQSARQLSSFGKNMSD
jgi:hypothetical protein